MSSLTMDKSCLFEKLKQDETLPDSERRSKEENRENDKDKTPNDNSYEHLPTFLRNLFSKGAKEPIDFNASIEHKPKWLDIEKFKRGQKVAVQTLIGASIADVLSIFLMFSLKPALLPLIFTGCTDTPVKCYRRYLYTFLKVTSWYKEDMWSRKNESLAFVNSTHKRVFNQINACSNDKFNKKISLAGVQKPNYKFIYKDAISEDAKKISPFPYIDTSPREGDVWMSQASMSLTQFTFVGLLVTYPKSFGIYYASEKDFEDFIHMWKGLGYLLGIKDEYNFCDGDLNTVRQRTKDLVNYIFKPSLKNLTDGWEHMSRCIVDGSRFYINYYYFETNLLLLFHILDMDMKKFRSLVPYYQRFVFYAIRFFIYVVMRVPYVHTWLRNWLKEKMDFVSNAPSEVWAKWEEREFPYINKKVKNSVFGIS